MLDDNTQVESTKSVCILVKTNARVVYEVEFRVVRKLPYSFIVDIPWLQWYNPAVN